MKARPTPQESARDWAAVAAAVLSGEWYKACGSELEALATGLRGYPEHSQALGTVEALQARREAQGQAAAAAPKKAAKPQPSKVRQPTTTRNMI